MKVGGRGEEEGWRGKREDKVRQLIRVEAMAVRGLVRVCGIWLRTSERPAEVRGKGLMNGDVKMKNGMRVRKEQITNQGNSTSAAGSDKKRRLNSSVKRDAEFQF